MSKIRAAITAVGSYVPERVLSNADLEKMVDTTDEWITTRTGIKERRILEDGLGSSFMAVKAVENLLQRKPIRPEEIDIIIFATVTPDMLFPSSACLVQEKIGAVNAWGYDLIAACSSFLFALHTGTNFIESGNAKKVLVIGADKMSSITNYTDRNACILFGDGAGCVLLEPSDSPDYGMMDGIMRVDGKGAKYLYMLGGGSLHPATHETVDKGWHYIYQEGQQVFKVAFLLSLLDIELVDVTPTPVLARFEGLNDWMVRLLIMFGGVFVFGRVTAAYVAAYQTESQMNPGISAHQAFGTPLRAWYYCPDILDMCA